MTAREQIAQRCNTLPKIPVEQMVDKAIRLQESAVDEAGAIFAGAWWRKVVECVRDPQAQSLATMRMRKMEELAICFNVRTTMESDGGSFSPELMATGR